MEKLFFGTGNPKKLAEIQGVLGHIFEIRSFRDLPGKPEVEETAPDLEGNAELKARAYFGIVGYPCFADDTGLEVDALNGAPGVWSARYAGPENDAQKNMEKLLGALGNESNRKARFRTVIAWYDGSELKLFEGILEGSIGFEPIGSNGFGYDPIFIPEGGERTLAEFAPEEKNKISHRGLALKKLEAFLS